MKRTRMNKNLMDNRGPSPGALPEDFVVYCCFWAYSSTAEQGTHNPLVAGSNPAGPTLADCVSASDKRNKKSVLVPEFHRLGERRSWNREYIRR